MHAPAGKKAELDYAMIVENDRLVVDSRVPGDTRPEKREYVCRQPRCTHTVWAVMPPECPVHHKVMVLKPPSTAPEPPPQRVGRLHFLRERWSRGRSSG